jgi:1-deoxy-D-xylulose-5-phosphate reductoisomerase
MPLPAAGPQGVTILGATGSIGANTLDVLARHPNRYRVVALTANHQVDRLFEQCRRFRPRQAVLRDPAAAAALRDRLQRAGLATEVLAGEDALETVARDPDSGVVMAAIVGAAGLLPVLAAVRAGKRVLLANKEPLVMCGELLMQAARASGAVLLPIDSEHNAIFQCLPAGYRAGARPAGVRRLLLTCSGGPFLRTPVAELARVTPDEACAHPRWAMGRKISVDSATLMNKGLELIEACWLFGVTPDQVEIVIHPQSVIHSLVDYVDGSVLAQLGNPDMRTPIAHALAWPERIDSGVAALDLFAIARLDFEAPDTARFPCLRLAEAAARTGGTAPAILNAANEVAVNAFLEHRLAFTAIAPLIEHTLAAVTAGHDTSLAAVLAADAAARAAAERYVAARRASVRSQAS